ncbi:MAG: Na/Pi symporter [Candidatus Marinimicrobia bacterium]|nr:Na/Pi symporter [Candidatus Neomarinimicrobiota bacterium]
MDIKKIFRRILKLFTFFALLYLFLLSIKLIGGSFKLMGKGFAETLIKTTSNPFAGLFIGILTTSIVQSSSMTTSLVVGLVATGVMPIYIAIPIVIGANIGTTITNIIVSLGHIRNSIEFERAFSASIVHDFFNFLNVLILFPLQYFFNFLGILATGTANLFQNVGGLKVFNPLSTILNPTSKLILHTIEQTPWLGVILSLALLFFSLRYIVLFMKKIVIRKIEIYFNKYLFKTTLRALLLGLIFTVLVQSSSITTSLAVPLAGAGILTIEKIFPYTLGANIGTTITALLAALATGEISAITVAFCHLFFNIIGTAIFLPLRKIPISMAKFFSKISMRNKLLPILYIIIAFFLIPFILILLVE